MEVFAYLKNTLTLTKNTGIFNLLNENITQIKIKVYNTNSVL